MGDLVDTFFSPLGKEWCMYYFVILIFVFFFLIVSVFTSIISLFSIKKFDFSHIHVLLYPIIVNLILYFQSRIIYSMCVKSLE